jgi:hypothetical protein
MAREVKPTGHANQLGLLVTAATTTATFRTIWAHRTIAVRAARTRAAPLLNANGATVAVAFLLGRAAQSVKRNA